ncbi:MAG: DUF4271 domain-containing protein [Flavobacteriales bacterium]|nr:DUF4271 domain-containing protein [Flavobacteriales bacterium]
MNDSLAQQSHLTWQDTAFFVETPGPPTMVDAPVSIFEGHLLTPLSKGMEVHSSHGSMAWAFMVMTACLFLYAVTQRGGEVRPSVMLRAAFDRATANHLLRYGSESERVLTLLMLLASLLSIGLFVTTLAGRFTGFATAGLSGFLTVTSVLAGLGLAVHIGYVLMGNIFGIPHLLRVYELDRTAITVGMGLLLLPCSAIHHFGPGSLSQAALVLGITVLILFYIKDLQRTLMLLWNDTAVSAAHIFYYFCALKILPLFAAIRIVTAW